MLDDTLKTQLKDYLQNLRRPIELVASLGDSKASRDLETLLGEIAELSDKVEWRNAAEGEQNDRVPSFSIRAEGVDTGVTFAGIPLGHEFTSLVLALLHAGGHPPKVDQELLDSAASITGDFKFETYFSLSCQVCPDVVQAFNILSVFNPNVTHEAIDGSLFKEEVESREIMAVPSVYLNGEHFAQGHMELEQLLAKLDSNASARMADALAAKDPFDMLMVGGGPAGAAAAIYSARKGISTGIVTERFGGQVLDTLDIENLISVPHTEGPELVTAMENHVKEYDVDIMNLQMAEKLIPAAKPGGLHEIVLENGASLKAKSLVLSTGARWRQLGVPGEEEYKNKGVAYCPHCDGPLFKGKRVAVVGGGNSGVEAAIDLAGIVDHVTLVEFDAKLRADAVLQNRLDSLPNVDVIVSAATTEINGDGSRVTGLTYQDRDSEEERQVELEGVFVQIGLVPNTEWLEGSIGLTKYGEIEVDNRGETSVPGIFAAGDATTVPYKQIVIAMGDGANAALSAFDYLIRLAPDDAEKDVSAAA
ncbi:MAG: alkyl hydroperoxide reductase subunit F [Rhodospirillaceae bacterium]|nr:alkyl hydroperoxide reductase subunit F [Rhodospirillaceae bacterium]